MVKLCAHSVEHRVRECFLLFFGHKHDVYVDDVARGNVHITRGVFLVNILHSVEHEETVIERHVHFGIHFLTDVKDGFVERPGIFFLIDVVRGAVIGDTVRCHFVDVQETVRD